MISSLIITIFPGIRINKSNFVNEFNLGSFILEILITFTILTHVKYVYDYQTNC